MFGFHWPELAIILFLALALFGPKRLPEIGASVGKGLRELRKSVDDVKRSTGIDEVRELGTRELNSFRDAALGTKTAAPKEPPSGPAPPPA